MFLSLKKMSTHIRPNKVEKVSGPLPGQFFAK